MNYNIQTENNEKINCQNFYQNKCKKCFGEYCHESTIIICIMLLIVIFIIIFIAIYGL
jgi:hypothetical protein